MTRASQQQMTPASGASERPGSGWESDVQCVRTPRPDTIELRLVARPAVSASTDFSGQASTMYENLLRALRANGARPSDIVTEKVFLSDIGTQAPRVESIRRSYLHREDAGAAPAPAFSMIGQPPALSGRACEIQAFVVIPSGGGRALGRPLAGLPDRVTGRVIEDNEVRQFFLAGLTGGVAGDGAGFRAQATSVFERAAAALAAHGLGMRDIVRTWIHLDDIDRDYDTLNRVRRASFGVHRVDPPPASTGIRGHLFPPDRLCGMDLIAIQPIDRVHVRTIHAPTMNEAPSYGADFCRGMTVETRSRRTIYLSGTASIDTAGSVVCVGDIEGQVDRMLLNVKELLAYEGASPDDLVTVTTYLKRPEYATPFRNVAARLGFSERIPNTLCVADVCRPEWLCEIEGIAVIE